jgi:2,5-furandicarboxylate decarboxylase 1
VHDLRAFLELIRRERPHDVVDVHREVNPRYETTAIVTKLEQAYRFPVIVFHRVAGSSCPVVTNVCGSLARMALALGCPLAQLAQRYDEGCANPIKPQLVSNAPVQEQVRTGEDVDLGSLPQFVYHQNDSLQPYITAAIVVARDPDTGRQNLSYHRLMVLGCNSTAIFIARGKHLDRIYRKYERMGEPMPIAAFIGVHPVCSLGALYTGSADTEEYDIIGGLQGAPLRIAKCVTQPLEIVADAEFVLEGVVLPRTRAEEGPFGEFTGYSTGNSSSPVFKLTAVTSRRAPMYQDIVSGHAEHLLLPILGMERNLLQAARNAVPSTRSVKAALPLTVFVALDKTDDSQPRVLMDALFASDIYVKQVVVVDAGIDISDIRQAATAIALNVKPDRDIVIHRATHGTELDPAAEPNDEHPAKLGIDATIPLSSKTRIQKNKVSQELLDSINLADLLGKP